VENIQLNIRLKEGNPSAFEELFKQTFPRMLGYCKLFIHDQAQANDLVQECFVKLWEKRNTIKTNQSIQISTELDENDFISARINFIETQFNPADKTNRVRVYLNNIGMKLPIGLRLQGVVKTNPVNGIWIQKQAMVSIGNKKIVFVKKGNGFKATAIKSGIEIGNFIRILDGISVQETIAENGNYLIDSESFIKTE